MPHEPWTVDQELSRLGESIKAQQQRDSDTTPEPGKPADNTTGQQIHGSRNIQVGGDLTLLSATPVDPHHPDALPCPQCQALTYRLSEHCPACQFNLRQHRSERARQEKIRHLTRVALGCGIPGALIVFTGTRFFAGHPVLYFWGVGGVLLTAAALAVARLAQS